MSNEASNFFRVPADITGLLFNRETGASVPYSYASYFAEYQLPRIPNKTIEENRIVQRLLVLVDAKAGDEYEWHASEHKAFAASLPQLGDQKKPEIGVPVYIKTQSFNEAVLSAPTKKPADWGQKAEPEPMPEPLPVEEAAQ